MGEGFCGVFLFVCFLLILHGVHPLSYFSFQPVLHDWYTKGCGMCYPVCGMVHIKEPLLLIGKSSPCDGSGFPLSLSEWSFTICQMPYNRKYNVLSASLNKTYTSRGDQAACHVTDWHLDFYQCAFEFFLMTHLTLE